MSDDINPITRLIVGWLCFAASDGSMLLRQGRISTRRRSRCHTQPAAAALAGMDADADADCDDADDDDDMVRWSMLPVAAARSDD